ncbi:MAG: hypothetical protein ACE37H_03655 [Phycisphaeraceae bacterium]
MADSKLHRGMLVLHPNKPGWGPGKIVKLGLGVAHVFWRDLPERAAKPIRLDYVELIPAADQHDDILSNLPPFVEEDGRLVLPGIASGRLRVTVKQAIEKLLEHYPLGFQDPAYYGDQKGGERAYKLAAHQKFSELLGGRKFRDLLDTSPELVIHHLKECLKDLNLLFPNEQMALFDAYKDFDRTLPFLRSLCELLEAEGADETSYSKYLEGFESLPVIKGRVHTWPVATIYPYIAQPEIHIFLKPKVTQCAAEILGFNLHYKSNPNWQTYSSLLTMAETYRKQLAALKPKDMIDMQSFFWITCGGYDED